MERSCYVFLRRVIILKKLEIFCGVSSLGMPFTKENRYHIGYYDIIVETLKSKEYDISGFNFSRLNKNHTWDLEEDLSGDKSLAYIKNLQVQSIDSLRNTNVLFKLVVPTQYKDAFKIKSEDNDHTLRSLYVDAENPIFLYSAGPNDFFSYIKAGPVELIDKNIRAQLPQDIKTILEQCIINVEKNWQLLHQLNPNTKIYSFSYYYSPLYDKIQKLIFLQEKVKDRNKQYVNKFMEVINLYNQMLFEASKKYDYVEHCDLTFLKDYCAPMDFHPNTLGNQLIANMLLRKIESLINKEHQSEDNNQTLRAK